MTHKHIVDEVADFVVGATTADISARTMRTLKRNVLDSIACAVGALDGELIEPIRAHAEQFSGRPTATFIGGGRASVDQAAFFNAVLVRYPDLLDTFLTPGGLCHPADNFGAVFAVAEHVGASGSDFLLALAVAYEIQCRFSAQVPVMARGLNHALQLAMSAAAGSAKLLDFDSTRTASAISASTVDNVSLAAVHAEPVSNWKGISPAITGMRAVYATMLAGRGITGPRSLFDGPNGLEQLFGQSIDMRTGDRSLTAVEQTYLKQYCSLIHGQPYRCRRSWGWRSRNDRLVRNVTQRNSSNSSRRVGNSEPATRKASSVTIGPRMAARHRVDTADRAACSRSRCIARRATVQGDPLDLDRHTAALGPDRRRRMFIELSLRGHLGRVR